MNLQSYKLDTSYVNQLIKLNEVDKIEIAKKLKITVNNLNLKLSGVSKLYIQEGITIASLLGIHIEDIFCPSDDHLINILYNSDIKELTEYYNKNIRLKTYNSYNFNGHYVKIILMEKGFTYDNLCTIWNRKIVSVYEKLRGETKISLEEGIRLSRFFDMDANDVFCPKDTKVRSLLKESIKLNYSNRVNDSYALLNLNNAFFKNFDVNNIVVDKHHIKSMLEKHDKSVNDLIPVWNVSRQQVHNKLTGKSKVYINDIISICDFLKERPENIFNVVQ